MRFLAVFIFFILNIAPANSQTALYYKYYDIEGISGLTSHSKIIQSSDKLFYYVAFVEFDTNTVNGGYNNNLIYSKLTTDGNVVWTKKISDTGNVGYRDVSACSLSNDGLLITFLRSGLKKGINPNDSIINISFSSVIVLESDESGAITNNYSFSDDSMGLSFPIVTMDDGFPYLSFGDYTNNSFRLTKFDLNLNPMWTKDFIFSDDYSPECRYCMSTSNNDLLLVGENWGYSNVTHGTLILDCDENGNINWVKNFATTSANYDSIIILDVNSGLEDNEHNIIFTASNQTSSADLLKITPSGQVLFCKVFSDNGPAEAYDILPNGFNDYMLVAEPELYYSHSMVALAEVDYNGNLNWMKIYGDTAAGSFPYGGVLNTDNTYTVFGINGHFGPPKDIILMRINNTGLSACESAVHTFYPQKSSASLYGDSVDCTVSSISFDSTEVFSPQPITINTFIVCDSIIAIDTSGENNSVFLPSAFTPNQGENNYFHVLNPAQLQSANIRIYNRWGQLIFYSENPNFEWDGTFHGKPQPLDTYVWYMTYELKNSNTEQLLKGDLTLIR